jgi:hypothetical protein
MGSVTYASGLAATGSTGCRGYRRFPLPKYKEMSRGPRILHLRLTTLVDTLWVARVGRLPGATRTQCVASLGSRTCGTEQARQGFWVEFSKSTGISLPVANSSYDISKA